jgi:hypothetical protein
MLVKIGFPYHALFVRPARVCTSAVLRQAVRLAQHCASAMWVLGKNLIFFSLFAYSPTPRATRNNLKPSSLVNSLHAS